MQSFIYTYIKTHLNHFIVLSLLTLVPVIAILLIFAPKLFVFAHDGDTSLIHGCQDERGRIIIVDANTNCNTNETAIDWPKNDVSTGWSSTGETWTYASSSSFTVPGDKTTKYQKGTRLKFTQNSVKYAVVVDSSYNSPNTTVAIAVNNDYSIDSSTISDNYYSYFNNPQGYPDWFNFDPVLSGSSTAGQGTYSQRAGRYSITGSTIKLNAHMFLTDHTGTGDLIFTLPLSTKNVSNYLQTLSVGYYGAISLPANTISVTGVASPNSTTLNIIGLRNNNVAANVSVDTWGNIVIAGTYEYN